MYKIFLYSLVITLISCSAGEDKGNVLAKVYEEELFEKDLKDYLKEQQFDFIDSAKVAEAYISQWVNEQILVHAATENKELDKEKIDRTVEQFKIEMQILQLEQLLVDEQLDTNISGDEIKDYYDAHQEDFQLNDYLVKVLYIKIPFDAPDVDQISRKYKLYRETDIDEIEIYAKIYASNFYYDEDNWIYFDDLLKEIPLQDINKDRFIMKRSKTRFEENGFYYFLNVLDYKLKNTISPLSFEKNNIKERILNNRIMNLREQIKLDIINNAYETNSVTIY
jgi:hypothetical protein